MGLIGIGAETFEHVIVPSIGAQIREIFRVASNRFIGALAFAKVDR